MVQINMQFFGGNGASSKKAGGGARATLPNKEQPLTAAERQSNTERAERNYTPDTKGKIRKVGSKDWEIGAENGTYSTIVEMPKDLMTLDKPMLSKIAKGLGESNKNIDGKSKKAVVKAINTHIRGGNYIYRVTRKNPGDKNSGYQPDLFATSKTEASRYAKAWIKSNT